MTRDVAQPQRSRVYLNPFLCSDYWALYRPRDDDIVIASAYKAGTTWMQTIVANLIFADGQFPSAVMEMSPWIDRYRPDDGIAAIMAQIERQTHRRFLKTHLPLDALHFLPQVKYLFLARDPRDIFMSLWNHHCNYSDKTLTQISRASTELGQPWPKIPSDINEFWRLWMTRAWFEWESEGYPYWSVLHNVASWWPYRHLPNVLFVHYNDLLADTPRRIQSIARFLDFELSPQQVSEIAARVTLAQMKQNASQVMGIFASGFKGGGNTFINKGTNGRWRGVLSDRDLELYDAALARNLDAPAARWSAHGGDIA